MSEKVQINNTHVITKSLQDSANKLSSSKSFKQLSYNSESLIVTYYSSCCLNFLATHINHISTLIEEMNNIEEIKVSISL